MYNSDIDDVPLRPQETDCTCRIQGSHTERVQELMFKYSAIILIRSSQV